MIETFERYIELMCQLEPNHVYQYLPTTDNYRLDRVLALCEKYQVTDATAWILERMGDIAGALKLILHALQDRVERVIATKGETSDRSFQGTLGKITGVLKIAIQLCQRNTGQMDPVKASELWFSLLDATMMPTRQLQEVSFTCPFE